MPTIQIFKSENNPIFFLRWGRKTFNHGHDRINSDFGVGGLQFLTTSFLSARDNFKKKPENEVLPGFYPFFPFKLLLNSF